MLLSSPCCWSRWPTLQDLFYVSIPILYFLRYLFSTILPYLYVHAYLSSSVLCVYLYSSGSILNPSSVSTLSISGSSLSYLCTYPLYLSGLPILLPPCPCSGSVLARRQIGNPTLYLSWLMPGKPGKWYVVYTGPIDLIPPHPGSARQSRQIAPASVSSYSRWSPWMIPAVVSSWPILALLSPGPWPLPTFVDALPCARSQKLSANPHPAWNPLAASRRFSLTARLGL